MTRRTRMSDPGTRVRPAPVTTGSVNPDAVWTLPQARDMVRQGYTVEHVVRMTGWPAATLRHRT